MHQYINLPIASTETGSVPFSWFLCFEATEGNRLIRATFTKHNESQVGIFSVASSTRRLNQPALGWEVLESITTLPLISGVTVNCWFESIWRNEGEECLAVWLLASGSQPGDFASWRHASVSGAIFGEHNWDCKQLHSEDRVRCWAAYNRQGKGQGAAGHPMMLRTASLYRTGHRAFAWD